MRWWVAYALQQKIFTYTEILEIRPQRFWDLLQQMNYLFPKVERKTITADFLNERRGNGAR